MIGKGLERGLDVESRLSKRLAYIREEQNYPGTNVDDSRSEERFSEEVRLPFFGVREKQAASMLGTRKSLPPFLWTSLTAIYTPVSRDQGKRLSFIFLLP